MMKKLRLSYGKTGNLLLWAGLLWGLAACEIGNLEAPAEAAGQEYFPLQKGRYVSYNVKETVYRLNERPLVSTYQIKEVQAEAYTAPDGQQNWRVVRYRRANGLQNWQIANVWTARQNGNFGMRTEDNVPYAKILFPVREGQRWNGNLFNEMGQENYEMRDLGRAHTFDRKHYSPTLTVLQRNDSSLVGKDKRLEIYAPGIGLIYRLADRVAYCQDRAQNCLGRAIIESGTVYEQSIFDSGIER